MSGLALTLALLATAPDAGAAPRVVTLGPALTDFVLALGKGPALVGVSRFDERAEVASLPRVGGFNDPSVESVAALRPTLVLVQKAPANQKPVEAMARLGIPVLALPLTTVQDVLEACAVVGRALGDEDQGKALARKLEEQRAQVRARSAGRKRPRVLFLYGFAPLVAAGPGSFADELLRDAGGENVALRATTAYPVYSAERAVKLAPDVVVDAAMVPGGGDALRALLPKSRWVKIPSSDLMHPGPALGAGLLQLEELLHGQPGKAGR